ncbi:dynein axonemal assembly factor 4 [Xylocopa sonorina]|uniref:dynein axonemal assembly factor 4 n=1 Tax=Xylocopa sonorina TaxID=1818115 RepID=UPI00403AB018
MPVIVIKDYSWRQSSEFVILKIPLNGHPKRVDFFVIDNYVKVSFPPFILELFLWANVVENESKCTLTEKEAVLSLRKVNIDLEWPALEIQDVDKDFKREYRNRALERAHKLAEEKAKIKNEKRQRIRKEAVKEQIDINTATLNEIDRIRDAHREDAMREFEDWRSKAELPFLPNVDGEVQENRKAYKSPLKYFKNNNDTLVSRSAAEEEYNAKEGGKVAEAEPKCENPKDEKREIDDTSCSEDSEYDYESRSHSSMDETEKKRIGEVYEKKRGRPGLDAVKAALNGNVLKRNNIFQEPSKSVPLPRKMGTINVTFSERVFPTPARESSHIEEQEWLQKQAEARRKVGFDAADLRPEERDPQWLKDKGDDFYKVGNYLAAISAYTYGIKISDKMAPLYVNRSAAHYALGNYCKCIEDCSTALELMEPKCEGNRESRAKCHARRGAALCKLSSPQHGIPELKAALELTPDNESIKRDILAARRYFDVKE